jgi:hypothetical protein
MQHLNHDAQRAYDTFVLAALRGGCDQKQAEAIAKERLQQEKTVSLPSR